jgi:hypothetical protein
VHSVFGLSNLTPQNAQRVIVKVQTCALLSEKSLFPEIVESLLMGHACLFGFTGNYGGMYPDLIARLSECFLLSIQQNMYVLSRISHIFHTGGPPAIARFIVAVIVYSINVMFGCWWEPHIL